MDKIGLPPLVSETTQGKVTSEALEKIDYQVMGYFLSCHLIIEHYMDEYLKTAYPKLDWESAKLTFGQRLSLMSQMRIPEPYDCIPAIKHLHAIRNKLGHNIQFQFTSKNLLPLIHYLKKVYKVKGKFLAIPWKSLANSLQ